MSSASMFSTNASSEHGSDRITCSPQSAERFRGKNILLTGASGGLGRSLALYLSSCDVKTILLSARQKEALEDIAADCQKMAASNQLVTHILPCDLGDKESVAKLGKDALERCSEIDVLINNGGVSSRSDFLDTALDVDEKVMQINFFAGVALCKAIVPGMVERGDGTIVWISSVQGLLGIPSRTSYAASKFAVQGYCESLRSELASKAVTVHVPSPGYIRTNLSRSAIRGDGSQYGKLDETTAKGEHPDNVAVEILDGVAADKSDYLVAAGLSATIAIWMRLLCPGLLRTLLVKRYEKAQKQKQD